MESLRVKAVALLLGGLLAVPAALAIPGTGDLHVAGSATFKAASAHDASALAAFCADTSQVQAFELKAPLLHVTTYAADYVDAATPQTGHYSYRTGLQQTSYDLTDVTVTGVPGTPKGWLGIDASPQGRLLANAAGGATLAVAESGSLGNGVTAANPQDPSYAHPVEHLLLLDAVGAVAYAGEGSAKILGLALDVRARENATTLSTGWFRDDKPVSTLQQRWVILAFPAGTLRMETARPCSVAAREDTARWNGEADFGAATGVITADGSAYRASGGIATLSGALVSDFVPSTNGMDVRVSGDVEAMNLASTTVLRGPPEAPAWPWMLLGALAILGGGAGAVLLKRRHDSLALGAEECAALAEMAVEAGQFDEALTWNVRARAASPRSARLWLDEGFYLERLDRPHDALAAYRAAAGLGAVADACLHEARLRLALGALAEAEDKLVDALHASPASLLEVEDGGFEALLRRPRVRTAMDAARRALGSPDG